jgi:hypothetical protein
MADATFAKKEKFSEEALILLVTQINGAYLKPHSL